MNNQALSLTLAEPDQAREAVRMQFLPYIGKLLEAGQRVAITACAQEDTRSLQQNKFYWGPCLRDISEQAAINGQKYSKDAWHELFKREHLPRVVTKAKVAGKKRMVVRVSIGSTKDLSVRRMGKFLDQVQAFAATELGVSFEIQNWQSYR